MKRFILTGTPGCGKTSILQALEMKGYCVVNEAATDVIAFEQSLGNAEPWKFPNFIDEIITLQKQRQMQTLKASSEIQFFDRSPLCTYALAIYLGFEPSEELLQEIERIEKDEIYQKEVFFIENLGFCNPTEARKISFEESLVFEKIHEETYTKFGYSCIKVPPISLVERIEFILKLFKKI